MCLNKIPLDALVFYSINDDNDLVNKRKVIERVFILTKMASAQVRAPNSCSSAECAIPVTPGMAVLCVRSKCDMRV